MLRSSISSLFIFCALGGAALAQAQPVPDDANNPAPGTKGNPDNVPFIGRSDAGGNPVRLARKSGHVSNYSEDKIAPYTIPDVLVMNNGQPVTSKEMWFSQRRPEILKFYRDNFYGNIPANAPAVTWTVTSTDENARDGTAISKVITAQMGTPEKNRTFTMNLLLPKNATGPVPVLIQFSFGGGGARRGARAGGGAPAAPPAGGAAPAAPAAGGAAAAGAGNAGLAQNNPAGGAATGGAPAEGPARAGARRGGPGGGFDVTGEFLARGWGIASLSNGEIQPDAANRWTEGVIGLTLPEGVTQPQPQEWGTIAAWAWGISRAIDYLETDKSVNAKQVAITGASRLGKTVLWASANDDRIAATFSCVSGEMGAALIRRDWGETLDDMAQNFSWQFAGNLQNWVGKWNELPVDQHMLVSLSAPRAMYVNGGLTDQWSDPKGEFISMVHASPVYELVGAKGLGVTELPEMDYPVATGTIGYHYHTGGHGAVPADWRTFMDFAERHFKGQSR